jgi:hypothetical protein
MMTHRRENEMMPSHQGPAAAGRPGTFIRVGREWVGWTELVAPPSAPVGGGGPGHFSPRLPLNPNADGDLPGPSRLGPIGAEPLDTPASAPKPANVPPVTIPASLGTIKEVQNEFVDYKIEAEIVADGSGGVTTGAETSFAKVSSTSPSYDALDGKITKFNGKFTFKGTIQIQTKYAADSNASTLSCYGRGTTNTDVVNRDITLGFHESCHRDDYQAFLKAHALPDPPTMNVGMKSSDYDKAAATFGTAVNKYYADMKADSISKTDDVGFTLNKSNRTNSCYVHQVP